MADSPAKKTAATPAENTTAAKKAPSKTTAVKKAAPAKKAPAKKTAAKKTAPAKKAPAKKKAAAKKATPAKKTAAPQATAAPSLASATPPASAFADAAGAVAHVRDVALERLEKVVTSFEATVERLETEIKELRQDAMKAQKAYTELARSAATGARKKFDQRKKPSKESKSK